MKFSFFYEKFAMGVPSNEGHSDVYVNPGWADRNEMVGNDKYASFRGIIAPNGDLYAWVDKGAMHGDVLFKLKLFSRSISLYIHPEDKHNVIISFQSKTSDEDKEYFRNIVANNQNLKNFLDEPMRVV